MIDKNNKDLTAAQMLFEARTSGRRKREIFTISKILCIKEEYLSALETGDYNKIPERVYILGFARNYAIELGLDPDMIVKKIKQELAKTNETDDKDDLDKNISNSKKQKDNNNKSFDNLFKFFEKNWLWILSFSLLIVLSIAVIFVLMYEKPKKIETDNLSNTEEVDVISVKEPEYKIEVRSKFGTENIQNSNIVLQATNESWVKIEDQKGSTVFSRVLITGDVYFVPSGNFKATFGNAGGIDIWVNKKLLPKIGALNTRKSGIIMTPEALLGSQQVELSE